MRCKRCKQIVLSAITESGRKVILDPDPARGGTMRLYFRPQAKDRFQAELVVYPRLKQYPGEL